MNLPHGCTVFEVSIHPTNWNTKKANVKEIWYINFLFKDPKFIDKYPFGKQIRIKGGINRVKDLKEKQNQISLLRDTIITQLEGGYNPITDAGDCVIETSSLAAIKDDNELLKMVTKDTPFIIALEFALGKIEGVPAYLMDIKSALRYVEIAANHFNYQNLPIYDIHTDHISNILEYCRSTASKIAWSNKRSNKVKGELGGLFKYLIEKNAASCNAPRDVRKLNEEDVDFERQTLTDKEITIVKDYLYKNNRPFYKFMMIFYYSGGRIIELMRLKGCNVDLKKQIYRTEVKKGGVSQISRVIVQPALEFWVEQMEHCGPDDYVFSIDLLPGKNEKNGGAPINTKQITNRWRRWVKTPLGISADFYALKHLNAAKIVEMVGIETAAYQMGHKSTEMVKKRYGKKAFEEKTQNELKDLDYDL